MMDRYQTLRANYKLIVCFDNGPKLNTTVRDAIPLFEDNSYRAVMGSAIKALDLQRQRDLQAEPGISPACVGITFTWLGHFVQVSMVGA